MSGFHLLPCPLADQLINGGKGGEAPASWKDKGRSGDVRRLLRTRGKQRRGSVGSRRRELVGKGTEIQKGQSGEMGGRETVGTGATEGEMGRERVKERGTEEPPGLCRVGTARAETKREDLSN